MFPNAALTCPASQRAVASTSYRLAQNVDVVAVGPSARKNPLPNQTSDKLSDTVASAPVRIALPLTCSQRAGFHPTRAVTDLSELKSCNRLAPPFCTATT